MTYSVTILNKVECDQYHQCTLLVIEGMASQIRTYKNIKSIIAEVKCYKIYHMADDKNYLFWIPNTFTQSSAIVRGDVGFKHFSNIQLVIIFLFFFIVFPKFFLLLQKAVWVYNSANNNAFLAGHFHK